MAYLSLVMGFYSRRLFPHLLEFAMNRGRLDEIRAETLKPATGDVLEIGFGTGRNLPFYPEDVTRLVGLEPNPGMRKWADERCLKAGFPVEQVQDRAESLPFGASSFDTVVSTFTLCSVGEVEEALNQARRVLKPGGRLLFAEHGLSCDEGVRKWQHRLTPVNRVIADGCHLNRDMEALIRAAGLEIERQVWARQVDSLVCPVRP